MNIWISPIYLLTFLCDFSVFGYSDGLFKQVLVEEIINKIGNFTLESLSRAPDNEKNKILKDIEAKVVEAVKGLGPDGAKYVKLIMAAVKIKAAENFNRNIKQKSETVYNNLSKNYTRNNEKEKNNEMADTIESQIEFLIKKATANVTSESDKQNIVENIKNRVLESSKRKQMKLRRSNDELKLQTDLIIKGIEQTQQRTANVSRRNLDRTFNFYKTDDKTKDTSVRNVPSEDFNCVEVVESTCKKIKSLHILACPQNEVSLNSLCDGVYDCPDKSDESQCTSQVVEKIHNSSNIISQIESYLDQNCYKKHVDNNLLARQNTLLRNVLRVQLDFIHKYSRDKNFLRKDDNERQAIVKQTVNEVAVVISILSVALEGALCTKKIKDEQLETYFKGNTILYRNDLNEHRKLGLQSICVCEGQYCTAKSCTEICKQVCMKKYLLRRWECRAIDGGDSISVDFICDGKLDCYDESDETDCVTGTNQAKFEATGIYNNILQSLKTKSATEFSPVRNKFLSLQVSIKKLQKSAVEHTDTLTIKSARDECLSTMVSIYDEILNKAFDFEEVHEVYLLLGTIKDELMSALKRTHTGNNRIIPPSECICSGTRCLLHRCSKKCVRACSVESVLTRYSCGDSNSTSIAIDQICNGKTNCPNGADEKDCKIAEICRKHHLVVLRHNIQDVGLLQSGTALGEVLTSWKTKVTSTLKFAENNDRPNPMILRDIIGNILRDLVMAYASMEDTRKNSIHVSKEFLKLSQKVLETLKSCGK